MAYRGRPENVVRQPEPLSPEWASAVGVYTTYLVARHLAERTIGNYLSTIRRLAVAVQKPPTEITRLDLLARLGRGIKPRSAQHERSAFKSFWSVLLDEGLVTVNPAEKLPSIKARKGLPRPITPEQFAALFTAGARGAYWLTQVMLVLAGYVGLRAHEIAKMRGEMIDLAENTITYVAKGGYERVQPLHPVVRAVAEQMPRRGWWFPSPAGEGPILAKSVSSQLGRRIRAAGIDDPRITGHSLRHMFATELARAGTDILVIKELMGHELLTSTQIYTQVDQSQKRDALDHLPIVDVPIVAAASGLADIPRLQDHRATATGARSRRNA